MSDPLILDAPAYEHGFVVGRYLTAVADGPDADRFMDFTPARGKVIFTPETVIRRHEGPTPALVVQRPVECALDDQGYLTSPGGGRGVGLIVGIYTVKFDVQGAQVPGPQRIQVKATHTEAAPLDLVLAMPDVVPPGSVVVVDESTAQRAEAAAARAEAIVTDLEGTVREVVASNPDLKGEPGDPGKDGADGRTPDLTWQGTTLAVDGVPGPDLRGPAGDDGEPGPAPSIKIGTVTSGATPSATITGTSPDLTLGLVLPKGDPGVKGDPGAPGVVSSASAYVIVGPGRPDTPSTTGGTITGAEPVGAEYRSTDGAGVGAFRWVKRPGGTWAVVDGDTGWRNVDALITGWTADGVYMRRIGNVVQWGGRVTPATGAQRQITTLPPGFQVSGIPDWVGGVSGVIQRDGVVTGAWYAEKPGIIRAASTASTPSHRIGGTWLTSDPFPATLPGTPA